MTHIFQYNILKSIKIIASQYTTYTKYDGGW